MTVCRRREAGDRVCTHREVIDAGAVPAIMRPQPRWDAHERRGRRPSLSGWVANGWGVRSLTGGILFGIQPDAAAFFTNSLRGHAPV